MIRRLAYVAAAAAVALGDWWWDQQRPAAQLLDLDTHRVRRAG